MKISDLSAGTYSLTLRLRNGKEIRVCGKITEGKSGKHFVARQSPKRSFAPSTKVLHKKEVKAQ